VTVTVDSVISGTTAVLTIVRRASTTVAGITTPSIRSVASASVSKRGTNTALAVLRLVRLYW